MEKLKQKENKVEEYQRGMLISNFNFHLECLTPLEIVKGIEKTVKSSNSSKFGFELKTELQKMLKEL